LLQSKETEQLWNEKFKKQKTDITKKTEFILDGDFEVKKLNEMNEVVRWCSLAGVLLTLGTACTTPDECPRRERYFGRMMVFETTTATAPNGCLL
jgi:hypothetical protein